jgi:hypothetical protein
LTLQIPDVGYTLVVSGSLALVWALVRTVLVAFPSRHGIRAVWSGERELKLAQSTSESAS